MTKRLVAVVLAAGLAAPALAQSLAEVAARERKARTASPAPSPRAYTDVDLHASPSPSPSASPSPSPSPVTAAGTRSRGWKAPSSPSPSPQAPGQATPAPTPEPPDRSEQERAALEARWRAVAAQRRDAVASTEALVATLDAKVEALRNDRSPVNLADPNREQTRRAELAAAMAELDAARAALAAARSAVDALEDDVRRAGGLPGWVR